MLHQLTNREGHTALLILSVPGESLARASATRARSGTFLIEATIVLTARSGGQNSYARLAPAAADQLGIGGITLFCHPATTDMSASEPTATTSRL